MRLPSAKEQSMKKWLGVLLIALAVLFLAGGGFDIGYAALAVLSGDHSSYVIGNAVGRGLIGVLFVLIALRMFSKGRTKLDS
jgi:hypothetical protein